MPLQFSEMIFAAKVCAIAPATSANLRAVRLRPSTPSRMREPFATEVLKACEGRSNRFLSPLLVFGPFHGHFCVPQCYPDNDQATNIATNSLIC